MTQPVRTAITMAALGVLLVVGVVVGWSKLTEPLPSLDAGTDTQGPCTEETVPAGTKVLPSMVTVSVYNAGTRSGLADTTMTLLAERGFGRGDTGNAERTVAVKKAQVWAKDPRDPAARLVASWLGPQVRVVKAQPLGVGVTVVVGNRFPDKLVQGRKAVVARQGATICRPNPEPIE